MSFTAGLASLHLILDTLMEQLSALAVAASANCSGGHCLEPIVNDYFGTVPSRTVESLLSAIRRYLLLSNNLLLFAHH